MNFFGENDCIADLNPARTYDLSEHTLTIIFHQIGKSCASQKRSRGNFMIFKKIRR